MNFTSNKYRVIFYEKDGCSGNKKQQKLLSMHAISFHTKSLIDTVWDFEKLNSFFYGLEKDEIINPFAPQIKNGEIDISKLSKDQLVNMMCKNPILIKRPLLVIGENKICGFDIEKINKYTNRNICESIEISTCLSSKQCKSV